MKRLLKEYRIEFIAGGVALIGIFLMIEPFDIREALLNTLTKLANNILAGLEGLVTRVNNRATVLSVSDVLGILLVLLAVGFIVWRIRFRFRTGKRWQSDLCPKCSSQIMRVHRNWLDHILGATLLPEARRYRCVDSECGWSGLLRRHASHRHHHREQVPEPESENP